MSDYESNYFNGILSAVILFLILTLLFWALSPMWFGFVNALTGNLLNSSFSALVPQLAPFINNVTSAIVSAFFALIATPLVYVVLLPFLRQPQQESY